MPSTSKPKKYLSDLGEFGLIDLIQKELYGAASARTGKKRAKAYGLRRFVVRGIGEDTAVIEWNKQKHLLLTTDMLVEGSHFTAGTSPREIGHKALAVNISDIVSMGGVPQFALVSLGVSGKKETEFVRRLYQGMKEISRQFNILIVGGDTVKSAKTVINVALTGEVLKKDLVTRCGARSGDTLYVTGSLGRALESGWHLKFRPRLIEVQYLIQKFSPTAMIDVSDGLIGDLSHILRESGVGAELYEKDIPLRKEAGLRNAFYDGEDFEILFALPARHAERLARQARARFPFFPIGKVTSKAGKIMLIDPQGNSREITNKKGFTHF